MATIAPPRRRPTATALRAESIVRGALGSAIWSAAIGLAALCALVFLIWIVEPGPSAGTPSAIRAGAQAWLCGFGVPLRLGGGSLSLPPTAVSLGLGWLLYRAGAGLTRDAGLHRRGEIGLAVGTLATVSALLAAAVAAGSRIGGHGAGAVSAAVHVALFAAAAAALGAAHESGALVRRWQALPPARRAAVRTGVGAAAGLLAAGATLAAVAGVLGFGTIRDATSRTSPGLASFALLAVVLGYLPTLALWGAAYAVGPGLALGGGAAVSALDGTTGRVPGVPLLAALPSSAQPWVLVMPVAVGLAAGLALGRGLPGVGRWAALRHALLLAGIAALALGAAGLGARGVLGAAPAAGPNVPLLVAAAFALLAPASAVGALWSLHRSRGAASPPTWQPRAGDRPAR